MSDLAITSSKVRTAPTFRPKSSAASSFAGIPTEKPKENPEMVPVEDDKAQKISAKGQAAVMLSQSMGVQKTAKPDEALQLFNEDEPSYKFTDEELEELKKKYDVEDMSREEQDALLKELTDKGIISKNDVSDFEWVRLCSKEDMDLFEYSSATALSDLSDTREDPIAGYLKAVIPDNERSILNRLETVIEAQENKSKFLVARRDELAKQDIHRDIQSSLDGNNAFADQKRQLLSLLEQLKR